MTLPNKHINFDRTKKTPWRNKLEAYLEDIWNTHEARLMHTWTILKQTNKNPELPNINRRWGGTFLIWYKIFYFLFLNLKWYSIILTIFHLCFVKIWMIFIEIAVNSLQRCLKDKWLPNKEQNLFSLQIMGSIIWRL